MESRTVTGFPRRCRRSSTGEVGPIQVTSRQSVGPTCVQASKFAVKHLFLQASTERSEAGQAGCHEIWVQHGAIKKKRLPNQVKIA